MANAVIYRLVAPNGKVYIGQTWQFRGRMVAHQQVAKTGKPSKLYNAIRKYGWDNFTKTVLVDLGDVEQRVVDRMEQVWIEVYQSVTKGLNSRYGGLGGRPSDDTKALWSEQRVGNTNCLGREMSPETRDKIRQKARGRVPTPESIAKRVAKIAKPVVQVGLDGTVIKTWASATEATRQLGIESIHKAVNQWVNQTAGGFQWFFPEDLPEHVEPRKVKGGIKKPVVQLSKDGVEIKTWGSISEAGRGVGISACNISVVVGVPDKSAGGYRWVYL